MNFRDLEYVRAVAKLGQFSQAAAMCNVSQPALSNQIKKLEQELGTELFHRRSGDVRVTTCGQRIVDIATRILDDAQKIKDTATEFRDPEAIPFKIGMTPTLAPYLAQYFAELFENLFPKMKVVMIEELPGKMLRMVENHDLDTALVAKINHDDALDFTPIWTEPLFLGMRQDHPLSTLSSMAAEEVPIHDFIRLPHSFGYALETRLPSPDATNRAAKRIDLSATRFETVCRHVCHSDDCTIVSALAAEQFKRDLWPLSFVPFEGPGHLRKLGAATRPNCPRKPLLSKIHDYIVASPPEGVTPVSDA
ncbi:MAG: LysR family transcriptional regulator [Pseudomonadota bacterium]